MKPIKTHTEVAILEVTPDRHKDDSMDLATSRVVDEMFQDFRHDPDLRVAIITGAGDTFLCPGWDLKAAADGDAVDGDYGVGGFGGLQELPWLNKPAIAAANGICCGGDLELALSANMTLAADRATFALPEIGSGTIADAVSVMLAKRIPCHIAMALLLTGRWSDAPEAKRWGLVNAVLPAADLMPRAWILAELLASGPPVVYPAIWQVVRESKDGRFQDIMSRVAKWQSETVDVLYGSEDRLDGALAFAEKRASIWKER